jgi:hypothetical protein
MLPPHLSNSRAVDRILSRNLVPYYVPGILVKKLKGGTVINKAMRKKEAMWRSESSAY